MAKLKKYGFIFIAPGYKTPGKVVNINSRLFAATITGVSTINDGCKAAKKMVKNGVQIIELCGGFEKDDLKKIKDAIKEKIPIGLVNFDAEEKQKLIKFLKE
jgi:hypothetical protein